MDATTTAPDLSQDRTLEATNGPAKEEAHNLTFRVAYRVRDDGVIECGVGAKSSEEAVIAYGATKREALRRALKKNAAMIARTAKRV